MKNDWEKAEEFLKNDGVVVLPTDTLYGIIGSALSKQVIEKIYKIKGRNENKPFIVLINSLKQLEIFGLKIGDREAKILEKFWPGKVSIILPCKLSKWKYIHRGTNTIAFRMIGIKNKNLFSLINKVGALVAPSVNKEGGKPAENISEAKKYFGKQIDLYINLGTKKSKPSSLIKFDSNKWHVLRQGEKKI